MQNLMNFFGSLRTSAFSPLRVGAFVFGLVLRTKTIAPGKALVIALVFLLACSGSALSQDISWSWERLADAPTSRTCGAAEVVDGKIYFIGGSEGAPGTGRIHEAYDIASDTWSTSAQYPHSNGRVEMGSAVFNERIYTFCGTNIMGQYGTTDVDYYDPGTDTWATGQGTYPLTLVSQGTDMCFLRRIHLLHGRKKLRRFVLCRLLPI